MKRALFSLLAGLVSLSLAGCTFSLLATQTPFPDPLAATPTRLTTATETPYLPLPTETPSPIPRPTDTLTPTEAVPNFYHGLAPTLEQFTELGSKADISKVIAYLRSQSSLLTEGSIPISTAIAQNNEVAIACNANYDNIINCAVAASVKVVDQGQLRWLEIIELRNSDGPRGYLTGYIYDGVELPYSKAYERLVANPSGPIIFSILRNIPSPYDVKYPYEKYNTLRPGVSDLVEQLLETQTVPPELEDQIVNLTNN